jgi:hypothetical protein
VICGQRNGHVSRGIVLLAEVAMDAIEDLYAVEKALWSQCVGVEKN